jgi:hypothetical protein
MINIYCIRPKGFNIGNDVIYLALNHFVRTSFNETINIISLPATSKYESNKKAGLTPQTIYEVNQYGDGLIIGGGNLYENGELEVSATAMKALEVPMMLFSLARGRIYNKRKILVDRTDVITDEKIILLNSHAALSLTRDLATQEYLTSLGCTAECCGCPTLFIHEIPQHAIPVFKEAKTDCLISIRTPTLMSIPIQYQYQVRDDLHSILSVLHTAGYANTKLLCHDHRDIPYASSFRNVPYLYTEDPYVYLTFLQSTRLCITYRLHSFLPCISYGVPAIKISYDERALSMLQTIGLDSWGINMLHDTVTEEISHRLSSLGDLTTMTGRLKKSRWPVLREKIIDSCTKFSGLVASAINT